MPTFGPLGMLSSVEPSDGGWSRGFSDAARTGQSLTSFVKIWLDLDGSSPFSLRHPSFTKSL